MSNATSSGGTHRRSTLETHDVHGDRVGNAAPPQHQVQRNEMKYTWEHSLLLPAHPEEIRKEVDILLSDLIVRLKQLLFNSILCAYYVGFIPMQFADVSELHGLVSSLSWCAFVFLCRRGGGSVIRYMGM